MRNLTSLLGFACAFPGMLGVVAGLVGVLITWGSKRLSTALATTPTITCGELVAGHQAPRVIVRGAAVAGPDGLYLAPLSGRECVWFRVVATQETRDETRTVKSETWRYSTSELFALSDGTGTVWVSEKLLDKALHPEDYRWNNMDVLHPSFVDPPTPAQRAQTAKPRKPGRRARHSKDVVDTLLATEGWQPSGLTPDPETAYWIREDVIPLDQEMTVLAVRTTVDGQPVLQARVGRGPSGASLRDLHELRAASVADAAGNAALFPKMLAWSAGALAIGIAGLWLSNTLA